MDFNEKFVLLENRVKKLESIVLTQPAQFVSTPTKKLSAKEFLMTKKLTKETQKTLALGYYLEHLEGMASFNIPDLEKAFRFAKEKLPKNINDTVNKNIARGLLMEAADKKDTKKAWCLTVTGEHLVDKDFGKTNN